MKKGDSSKMFLQIQRVDQMEEIPIKVIICNTFFCRLRGLMFRNEPLKDEALFLIPCNSIHMFFMKFPIDAVFLDNKQTIVKVVKNVQPWSVVSPNSAAHSTLELPVGTIEKYSLVHGLKLICGNRRES